MSQLSNNINKEVIPRNVTHVTETLEKAGFEAFIVGGCIRDLLLDVPPVDGPKDWDITTNATPDQIINLFEKTVYENTFGTVGVCIPKEGSTESLETEYDIIEVTPYRIETTYTDFRHPDEVSFGQSIEDDLKRRDFTMNALAYSMSDKGNFPKGQLIDLYGGIKDIKDKVIRTVGEPTERFNEDALRMLRAIRFSSTLGFAISSETTNAIVEHAPLIKRISAERIRDEFKKIIMSKNPMSGIGLLIQLGLNKNIIPELEEGIKCEQKGEHIYDVFEHILHALGHASEKGLPLDIRLSALFHDIGKPRTRRWDGTKAGGKGKYTFYGHEVIGARMTGKIMERLKFPKDITDKVVKMVRYHMFFSDTELITLSAVRRTIVNVGKDNIWDLMEVRECDRVGMKKKEAPYRLRKYHAMIEEALRDPISVSQLKVDGAILMGELGVQAGPRMGWMLHTLLEEVLDDPTKNTREYLDERVEVLKKMTDEELKTLGAKGKEKKEELEEQEIKELNKKHGVK